MDAATRAVMPPDGRVVMVSGANRGIGLAVAGHLNDLGYRLSLGARRPESLADLAGETVLTHGFDATRPADAGDWVRATAERFGRIDALINCAGILHDVGLDAGDEALLDEMWEVNVKAPFRLSRLCLPYLRQAGSGRIVNVVSTAGLRFRGGSAGYAITKFATTGLSHATRFAGWEDGVRVTALCPGPVATDMGIANVQMPADEMTQPETIAAMVATLLSLPNTASVAQLPVHSILEPTV